jgi:hypothetical protein
MPAGYELNPTTNLSNRLPMANSPFDAGDPMAREVDRLLAQLDRKLQPSSPVKSTPPVTEARPLTSPPAAIVWASAPAPAPIASTGSIPRVETPTNEHTALWGRVLLGISLGIIMIDWPYAHSCGWALLGYSLAVVTVLITGAWIALVAWRRQSGAAHLLALLLFYWGLVLSAEQLLPRVGYGWTEASWTCSATPSSVSNR